MKYIPCPKCKKEVEINIKNALDEEGEVFHCHHCGWYFRYTTKIS